MRNFLLLLFVFCFSLFAEQNDDLNHGKKPEIIFFTADSIMEDEIAKYVLRWKIVNANKAKLTFIGNVKLEDSITITKKEFEHGQITLDALNEFGEVEDSVTLNSNKNALAEPTPVPKSSRNAHAPAYYNTVPMYRYHASPYPHRRVPRRYRRY